MIRGVVSAQDRGADIQNRSEDRLQDEPGLTLPISRSLRNASMRRSL